MNTIISLVVGISFVIILTAIKNLCRRKGWNEDLLIKKMDERRDRKNEKWVNRYGTDKYGNTVVDISKL